MAGRESLIVLQWYTFTVTPPQAAHSHTLSSGTATPSLA